MVGKKSRQILLIYGDDCIDFLQQMVSNDVKRKNDIIYTLILTPQGKIQSDFFVINLTSKSQENNKTIEVISKYLPVDYAGEFLLLDCHVNGVEDIINILNKYKLASNVEWKIIDEVSVYSLAMPIKNANGMTYTDPRHGKFGIRLYANTPLSEEQIKTDVLENTDNIHFELKLPQLYRDFLPGTCFPFELGFDAFNAISYDKGCYIGQEVITRTHFRGTVRKKIYKIYLNINEQVESISEFLKAEEINSIFLDNKKIGRTIGIYSDKELHIPCLALINTELLESHYDSTVQNIPITLKTPQMILDGVIKN